MVHELASVQRPALMHGLLESIEKEVCPGHRETLHPTIRQAKVSMTKAT